MKNRFLVLLPALLMSGCAALSTVEPLPGETGVGGAGASQDRSDLSALGVPSTASVQRLGRISATTPVVPSPILMTSRWHGVINWTVQNDPQVPNDTDFPYEDGLVELGHGTRGAPMGDVNISVHQANARLLADCVVSTDRLTAEVYDGLNPAIVISPLAVPYINSNGTPNLDWFVVSVITPANANTAVPAIRLYRSKPADPADQLENWVLRHCDLSLIN